MKTGVVEKSAMLRTSCCLLLALVATLVHWPVAGPAEAGEAPASVSTLTKTAAQSYVLRTLRQRAGEGATGRGSYRFRCSRSNRLRFYCRFSASAGDSSYSGKGPVYYSTDPNDDQVHYRYVVTLLDEYCYYVTQKSNPRRYARCSARRMWRN